MPLVLVKKSLEILHFFELHGVFLQSEKNTSCYHLSKPLNSLLF